jgi:DNA-binding NarL/FixJ family response regulator
MKRVVVVEDHALMLGGVVRSLSEAEDMQVVGTASSGAEVMSLVKEKRPDILLLDINLPAVNGLTCLELVRRNYPDVKVVMLSGFDDRAHIDSALSRGASAYIIKSIDGSDLASVVRQACNGTVFYPSAPSEAEHSKRVEQLTARERTILAAVARGLSNKAISKELWVTEQTVKFHLNNLYRKLGVENRASAVRWAFENAVVDPEPQPA